MSSLHFQPDDVTSAQGSPFVDGLSGLAYLVGSCAVSLISTARGLHGPLAGQSTSPEALGELKHGS
ncbi:MAG TPA: hypothetical protein VME22_02635 [Solirubrobacteraceae bacterium]|nr:hypothetical protein [Solirubrobacteraceae bacterium]